jgi:hypothetical protein
MEIEASCRLQNSMKLKEPVCHHDQVSHHVGFFQKSPEGLAEFGKVGIRLADKLKVFSFGLISPRPRILKGGNLGIGIMSRWGRVKDVVIAFGIEGRIEIDQVDGIVREGVTVPENFEIVAIIKGIGVKGH